MSSGGITRRRALFAALLVFTVLVMSAAAARAATPAIPDSATPPARHFSGACSGCHVVEPAVPEVRAAPAAEPTGSVGPGHATGHVHPALPHRDHGVALSADRSADRDHAPVHETVSPRVRERDNNAPPSDPGDKRPHFSDQSDASQHDGGGAGRGSSH